MKNQILAETGSCRIRDCGESLAVEKWFNGHYDHDDGWYPVAYIKLSRSKRTYMDDYAGNMDELFDLLKETFKP